MFEFIIVEDNIHQRKLIGKQITRFMMKNNYEYDISEFSDYCPELEAKISDNENNHIYILDFELLTCTAIDVARKIRQVDWTSPIIVYTAHGGMAFETFKQRLQILDFVNKQFNSDDNLFELFEICFQQFKCGKNFNFKIRGVDYNIAHDKILYIYRDTVDRKIVLVTDNNEYRMNINISDMPKLLNNPAFKITHKACIVNFKRVEAVNWKENKITFDNKEEIFMLSKTHKKEIEEYVVA